MVGCTNKINTNIYFFGLQHILRAVSKLSQYTNIVSFYQPKIVLRQLKIYLFI